MPGMISRSLGVEMMECGQEVDNRLPCARSKQVASARSPRVAVAVEAEDTRREQRAINLE